MVLIKQLGTVLTRVNPFQDVRAFACGMLLAEEPLYSQMGARFRDNSGSSQLAQLIWLVVPCMLIILAIWSVHRLIEKRKELERTSPKFLFLALCKAHQLTRSERQQLWKHSRRLDLENPAAVFVSAEAFAEPALAGLNSDEQRHLSAIGERLVGRL